MKKLIIIIIILLLCSCRPIAKAPQNAQEARRGVSTLYLPYLASVSGKTATGPCSSSVIEQQLMFLFVTDPGQKRAHPVCSPYLMRAAQRRAQDMVDRKYFNHTSPDGVTPNEVARKFGCALPAYYPAQGNQIESIGLNYVSAGAAWDGWKLSPGHRAHVLGTDPFWAEQNSYGLAVAESDWGRVFVLMTAPGCANERVKDDN